MTKWEDSPERKRKKQELDPGLRRDGDEVALMQIDDTPPRLRAQPNENATLPPTNPSQINTSKRKPPPKTPSEKQNPTPYIASSRISDIIKPPPPKGRCDPA
jgi:hypothetical protein